MPMSTMSAVSVLCECVVGQLFGLSIILSDVTCVNAHLLHVVGKAMRERHLVCVHSVLCVCDGAIISMSIILSEIDCVSAHILHVVGKVMRGRHLVCVQCIR